MNVVPFRGNVTSLRVTKGLWGISVAVMFDIKSLLDYSITPFDGSFLAATFP